MTNVQYITDAEGLKIAVIVPIEDYVKVIEEKYSKNSYEIKTSAQDSIQRFLIKQMVLSTLDKTFDYLKIPIDHSSKRGSDASLLLFALVEWFYYSKNINIDYENYEITLMDTEFSRFQISINQKTIQTQRNANLIPYIESNKKSIVEIHQHPPQEKKGFSYKLNFLEAIENAISEFFKESNVETKEIVELIEVSKRIKFSEIDSANKRFKNLWEKITFSLDKLPHEPKIQLSTAAQKSKDYQSGKE